MAISSDDDCVRDTMLFTLAPLDIFFSMFHGFTNYEGKDPETGHHLLKVDRIEGIFDDSTPDFIFYFSDTKPSVIQCLKIESGKIGTHHIQLTEKPKFNEEPDDEEYDIPDGCRKID